ncbi:MAG: hypothetical protein WEG36_04750 [Gemmatimonadota bacterium]
MRILLDESIPRPLKREFTGLEVAHVADLGWQGRKNGDLVIGMRDQGFDALITVDLNLEFQQNVPASGIAVVVLQAASNRLVDLRPLIPAVRKVLATAVPGNVFRVGV